MDVPPHPHTGLQTVSWLFAGAIEHRDSAGFHETVRPGELNLMTAGHGVAHSEVSTASTSVLHGVQLWVALPDHARHVAPAWEHHTDLPVLRDRGTAATVILGSLAGATSPGHAHSPLVGVDVALEAGADVLLPLESEFEHAVLIMAGSASVDGAPLDPGKMIYLGCGRRELRLASAGGARVLLLGGVPFDEEIVMWWNFVARANEEIAAAREQWMAGDTFGDVAGYGGYRLAAPDLPPGRLKPGGAVR
jgi:redox-sensitive bicupin YhaK (pirin superfamily)